MKKAVYVAGTLRQCWEDAVTLPMATSGHENSKLPSRRCSTLVYSSYENIKHKLTIFLGIHFAPAIIKFNFCEINYIVKTPRFGY